MYPPSRSTPSVVSDEIDLFELVARLWRGRYLILLFVLVGGLAAGIYAFNLKQQWTSVAYLNAPRVEQVKAYLEQRRALARVDGNRPVDTSALTHTLFDQFIALSVSARHKMEYIQSTDYFKELLADSKDPANHRLLLSQLERDALHIKRVDKDKIAPYYEFSFSADTAETAQRLLQGYLASINTKSFNVVDAEFNDALDAQLLSRETELDNMQFGLESERDNRAAVLLNALDTAKNAGLKDYIVGRNVDGTTVIELSDSKRLYMLGENYLNAELATTRSAPLIYPTRYYEIKRELELLQPLRQYEVTTLSYDYQLRPTLPVRRDSPKRALIIMLGVVLGGMLACFLLLVSGGIQGRKAQLSSGEMRGALIS